MNNNFLNEHQYCDKIVDESNLLVWWDTFKYKIKQMSQLYGGKRSKQNYRLQNKFDELSQRMTYGLNYDVIRYERLKEELASMEEERCQEAILRSKSKWALDSDRCTKYFLNLEKYRQKSNSILSIRTSSGQIINNTDDILKKEYSFYSQFYSNVYTEGENIDIFLNVVNKNVMMIERCVTAT